MTNHEFTLILDRAPSDTELDALFEAGCDDGSFEIGTGASLVHFDRDATSLAKALVTAIQDCERAGFRVEGVQTDDLVPLRTIADRLGRSYESVRLLATAQRGPGGFPAPLSSEGWALYSWSQVVDWSTRHLDVRHTVDSFEIEITATDHLVRARNMLRDNADRAELAQLLTA